MKLISWNVNGLRACLTHDFAASFAALDADVFSVQETKMQPGQADFAPEGYTEYTYSAEKKGYSGTACWCKTPPLRVTTGIGREEHDHEGRVLTLEYPGFYLVNCYTPNSQDGLKRLSFTVDNHILRYGICFCFPQTVHQTLRNGNIPFSCLCL